MSDEKEKVEIDESYPEKDELEEPEEETSEPTEKKKKKVKETVDPKMYKGYDIRWLKKEGEDHPDFKLVAEYEKEFGEVK